MRNVFRMKILIGITIIIASLGVMLFLHEPLINMFLHEGSDSGNIVDTFNYARNYLYVMVIGIAPFVVSNCYSTTLKESGQTIVPMKAGVLAVVFDIVLNYIFILGNSVCLPWALPVQLSPLLFHVLWNVAIWLFTPTHM